jgi:hypothetical protein
LDSELESTKTSWKPEQFTSIDQRHKDVFSQPRNKLQLQPVPVPFLPYVTKSCKKSGKYIVKLKDTKTANEINYFDVDHLLVKNFPTITIRGIDISDPKHFYVYLRFTNPNNSICVIEILKLKESQTQKDINCSVEFPLNPLHIDYYNELIEGGNLEMSTEMHTLEVKEEDKIYIKEKDKNFILFKLPGKMKKDHDCTKEEVAFGFNVNAKFERESMYQMKVPIYISVKGKEV